MTGADAPTIPHGPPTLFPHAPARADVGLADRLRRAFGLAPTPPPAEPVAAHEDEEEEAAPRRRVHSIRADVLEMICEAARATHPNEFGAVLRAEQGIVTELVLVPGTLGGDRHAILPLGYLPVDRTIVGTVHSHPGPYAIPSSADEELFRGFGHTHIIIAEPYDGTTWIAYDQDARQIELDVVVG